MKKTFVAIVSGLLICATLSSEASAWAGPMAKAAALVGDAATATAEQFCLPYINARDSAAIVASRSACPDERQADGHGQSSQTYRACRPIRWRY